VPPVPARIRNQARALHGQLGGERFRKELARIDAEAAARLHAGDAQRLIRAYEVAMATGRPLAEWQRQAPQGPTILARFATIILLPPRSQLYARLDARFEAMMAAGALEEVRNLLALGLDPAFPAMKAVGVRELASYLHGRASLAEAVGQAQQATRQFAKRQMTWIRHQMIGSLTEFQQYSERLQTNIFSFIRQFLLTTTP
jgi:tRNA dimethylallyltransferase